MRARSGIITRIMKIPKRIYLVAAVLLVMGGVGTGWALKPDTAPKEVTVKQVAAKSEPVVASESVDTATTTQEAPAVTEPAPNSTPTNPFQAGFSAWYVFNRRAELGKSTPASSSADKFCLNFSADQGFSHPQTPELHSIACKTGHAGSGDHLMIVEAINGDGGMWVSEMNAVGQVSMTDTSKAGGWNQVDYRLIPADGIAGLSFTQ